MANGGIIGPINDPTQGYQGGTVTSITGSTTFTKSTTNSLALANVLVVAGGGGGGTNGGGGGAGGFRLISCHSIPASGVPVTIGSGGSRSPSYCSGSNTAGSDSVFGTASSPITSAGGGRGGSYNGPVPLGLGGNGGSGGGAGCGGNPTNKAGGTGNTPPVSPPQGNPGGPSLVYSIHSGGGGAGATGTSATPTTAGPGGAGSPVTSIFGAAPQPFYLSDSPGTGATSSGIFAGGGGGAFNSSPPGTPGGSGGTGGGGNGSTNEGTVLLVQQIQAEVEAELEEEVHQVLEQVDQV
jgi:hypothetical protein